MKRQIFYWQFTLLSFILVVTSCKKNNLTNEHEKEIAENTSTPLTTGTRGGLDPTFGNSGIVKSPITPFSISECYTSLLQRDGKIIVAGRGDVSSEYDFVIARYKSNGQLDSTFGTSTYGFTSTNVGSFDVACSMAFQGNKIIVAGNNEFGNANDFVVMRYSIDGKPDQSFGNNGVVITNLRQYISVDAVKKVAVQPDGKIIVVGMSVRSTNTDSDLAMVRYNVNGQLDPTFGNNGIVFTTVGATNYNIASDIKIQPDGKIVTTGTATINSTRYLIVCRYNTNGTLDNTFGENGIYTLDLHIMGYGTSLDILSDGSILAGGYGKDNTIEYNFLLVKLDRNGKKDPLFGNNGIVLTSLGGNTSIMSDLQVLPNNKIITAGNVHFQDHARGEDVALVRYNSNGSLDNSFGNEGKIITSIANNPFPYHNSERISDLLVQPDGKYVVSGSMLQQSTSSNGSNHMLIVRYLQ